jgi:uroporphyrinogen-III synthase
MPTITILPVADWSAVDAALRNLGRYDWVVFTSSNAVEAFFSRLDQLSLRLPPAIRVAAVGPPTAAALAARGASGAVLPMTFRGEALAAVMPGIAGARLLLPRGDLSREATVATLEAAGAVVDPVTVYHTVPAAIDSAHRAALATGVDAITFTSPSTVRNFVAALGPEAVGVLRRTVVASIGPVTSEAVTDLGLPAPLEAPEATTTGLVAALEAHFS